MAGPDREHGGKHGEKLAGKPAEGPGDDHADGRAEAKPDDQQLMVTVILRHHTGMVLDEIQATLKASDWWESFPPPGVRIVSWVVAMGFGQIATFALPPKLLPVLNLELERRGWGVFSTEVYPTYDFVPVRERIRERVRNGGQ